MLYRRLGRTGLEVSRLGLGTMQWGETVDEIEAQEQLSAFRDAGGTLIDTSASYGSGSSETTLGRAVAKAGCRDDIVLATKTGYGAGPQGMRPDTSRRTMLRQLDTSLQRLGTDWVDLWQVQVWDESVPIEETLATLETAVNSGRVRYVGISNFTGWQSVWVQTMLNMRPVGLTFASSQVEYSLLNRQIEMETLPALMAMDMGVLAWSPLGRGVLTGKYRTGVPSDSRAAHPGLDRFVAPYFDPESAAVVEAAGRAAEGLDLTLVAVCLAWLRDRSGVSSAIVGARTADQLRESLDSEESSIPAEIISALNDVSGNDVSGPIN